MVCLLKLPCGLQAQLRGVVNGRIRAITYRSDGYEIKVLDTMPSWWGRIRQ